MNFEEAPPLEAHTPSQRRTLSTKKQREDVIVDAAHSSRRLFEDSPARSVDVVSTPSAISSGKTKPVLKSVPARYLSASRPKTALPTPTPSTQRAPMVGLHSIRPSSAKATPSAVRVIRAQPSVQSTPGGDSAVRSAATTPAPVRQPSSTPASLRSTTPSARSITPKRESSSNAYATPQISRPGPTSTVDTDVDGEGFETPAAAKRPSVSIEVDQQDELRTRLLQACFINAKAHRVFQEQKHDAELKIAQAYQYLASLRASFSDRADRLVREQHIVDVDQALQIEASMNDITGVSISVNEQLSNLRRALQNTTHRLPTKGIVVDPYALLGALSEVESALEDAVYGAEGEYDGLVTAAAALQSLSTAVVSCVNVSGDVDTRLRAHVTLETEERSLHYHCTQMAEAITEIS